MKEFVLVTTIEDPKGRYVDVLREEGRNLRKLFKDIFVVVSPKTHTSTKRLLKDFGQTKEFNAEDKVGESRRQCIRWAQTEGFRFIQYTDLDRILHWIRTYPDELVEVTKKIKDYDFTVLGRTPRAFSTHNQQQREVEGVINRLSSQVFGVYIDPTSGACAMKNEVARGILDYSRTPGFGTDTEWPAIVKFLLGGEVGFIACDGLEWETPDLYQKEIAKLGFEEWDRRRDEDLSQWVRRLNYAAESVNIISEIVEGKYGEAKKQK